MPSSRALFCGSVFKPERQVPIDFTIGKWSSLFSGSGHRTLEDLTPELFIYIMLITGVVSEFTCLDEMHNLSHLGMGQ
jgi:hypothetical protein